jgi:signal transduction histidine kinase
VVVAVDLGIAITSAHVSTSLTTSDLGLAFVFVVAAATRSARAADARSSLLLAQLEQSRAAQEAAAALAERARLAREIHDILAHSLSGQVMSLEATRMLAERTAADPRVVTEIDRAHRLAKDGLGDTRRAIGALRGDALPGPERLAELVEDAQAAHGIRASLTVVGQPRPLAADAGLCLYRTAQEALTNTAKHAGRGATARVVVQWDEAAVHLEVTDTRRPTGADTAGQAGEPLPSGGYGLTGLRERAELAGGALDTGPTGDGFRVALTLPTPPSTFGDRP